jgi:hemolysin III
MVFYLASTLYHLFSNTTLYYTLKKIDHLSIYFLIAGTYLPLTLIGIKSSACFLILSIVWGLAFVSCFLRLSKYKFLQNVGFMNYLVMGWLIILVKSELSINISSVSYKLLFVGGITYTSGIIFYLWNKLPLNHSIWHVFVLGGSTCHYFSIYNLLVT